MKKISLCFTPDAKGRIRMVVRHAGERVTFNVGFAVDVAKWSREQQRCKRNTSHGRQCVPAARINAHLQSIENAFSALVFTKDPTKEELHAAIQRILGREPESSKDEDFFSLFREFIRTESVSANWSKNNGRLYDTLYRRWRGFRPNIVLADITKETLTGFRDYLLAAGVRNTTARVYIARTKTFFRWLLNRGAIHDASVVTYVPRLKIVRKTVIFLTREELMSVYTHDLPEAMARVRDCFCFSCFTGLRYSDMSALRKEDVLDGVLRVVTQKTTKPLEIELNRYSAEILSRYSDEPGVYALPHIELHKMNRVLPEIGRICGIDAPVTLTSYIGDAKSERICPKWEVLTTHVGRKTFICSALSLGIAPNVVMKWTGHGSYDAMRPYIDITDDAKQRAMRLFDDAFFAQKK